MMLHDSMNLSRLMVHVQQFENNRKKRRVYEVRSPKPTDEADPSSVGGMRTFGVCD